MAGLNQTNLGIQKKVDYLAGMSYIYNRVKSFFEYPVI